MKLHDAYYVQRRSALGDIFRDAMTCAGAVLAWVGFIALIGAAFIAAWVITP